MYSTEHGPEAPARVACVGSANVDQRSTHRDDELCLPLYAPATIARLEADFDADLERSTRLTTAEWRRRSWWSPLVEWFTWRFRRHLRPAAHRAPIGGG